MGLGDERRNKRMMEMHIQDFEVIADPDGFNRLRFADSEEERDKLIDEGWTLCQTETAIVVGASAVFKNMEDGVMTMHVMGRNE